MLEIKNKSECSGCHACTVSCPKHAISMKCDKEGFLYPDIDRNLCVNCSICDNMCQAIKPIRIKREPDAYACWNRNESIRMESSSGGVFTVLAEWIVSKNGIIFGAAFDDDFKVKHIKVDSKDELYRLRGSKYVQSIVGDTYKEAKYFLENGKYVLFTGTPCQIDGLLHYLGKQYENLYTQDIICHGVPSSKVWENYLKYQCNIHNSQLKENSIPLFRNKVNGWKKYSISMCFENNLKYCTYHWNDIYMQTFLKNISLRPSCYECHSKSMNRNSDITLADFWGIEKICPEMFDDKGTSLIILNTQKGKELFEILKEKLVFQEVDYEQSVLHNSAAYQSVKKSDRREDFFKYLSWLRFDLLVKRETNLSIYKRVYYRLRYKISEVFRK